MIVEQALFGEVHGGHGLRAAGGNIPADLAPRLDLPDTAPRGVRWQPFLRGFPRGDLYVLARTFPDPRADRSGMVLTHALMAPLEELIATPDLRPLIAALIVAPADLRTLEVGPGTALPPEAPDLAQAAAALTTHGNGPIVRAEIDGFDDLVASLWGRLWPEIRRTFAFRLSFGPTDLVETPQPALICTPPELVSRWNGHRLISPESPVASSPAATLLCGRPEGDVLRVFGEEIGAALKSFGDLALLESTYLFSTSEPEIFNNVLAAVRLTQRLSPDPDHGSAGKTRLLSRLVGQIREASAAEALTLRNLNLTGFAEARPVWTALSEWLVTNSFPATQDESFRVMVANMANPSQSVPDWRIAILNGLSTAARTTERLAFAFWRWSTADPTIVRPLCETARADDAFEDFLVETAPDDLATAAAREILDFARERQLHRLHGVTASAAFSPVEAARMQVAVEPPPAVAGLRLALRNAAPAEVIGCAVDIGDSRIIDMAAKAVAATPELLTCVDLSEPTARAIWTASLGQNPDAWRGPIDPRATFETILLDLLDGRAVEADLINHLSLTPLADLSRFTRRVELWPQLRDPARTQLLRATASGWLTHAPQEISVPEAELQVALRGNPELDKLLDQLDGEAVRIMAMLADFEEHRFLLWLHRATTRIHEFSTSDSVAIGHLVRDRRWKPSADELLRMLERGREDVRPALRTCASLFGMFDRWRHRLSEISSDEKWDLLEELVAQLYPTGPGHDGLWERSGGHDADLASHQNGRGQWRETLIRIRRGSGRPPIGQLLNTMREDYPANVSLTFLAGEREFEGRR
ncbi:effector-associated domain EAD1-containing protein [Microtetraspora sp. NBRC 16547]|uniref:GAP1-N1 domain-containing protein n=1 Tax=Microtetraspora sp. NBRC 16547 TaxID=3030993 RepID=UPI0024A0C809|nr:effector-associated domain EAD1-containing protein [Microtetraspora sp. NBRC 16547]GLW98194.1 hypothetical protein Misp02_22810 [Microtetraspora sp. NBRC 16547]